MSIVIRNYWEATAGSTLIFDAPDALSAPTVALLYQGGYLTIDRRIDSETVVLKIPNEEVRNSLYRGYVSSRFGIDFELDDFSLTAEAALTQSREKRYADAYLSDGRRVVYVGVNYDRVRTGCP